MLHTGQFFSRGVGRSEAKRWHGADLLQHSFDKIGVLKCPNAEDDPLHVDDMVNDCELIPRRWSILLVEDEKSEYMSDRFCALAALAHVCWSSFEAI